MKRTVLVAGAALVAFAVVQVSANTLGGVRPQMVGAGADLVASCDTDGVDVDIVPTPVGEQYQVDEVRVRGIDARCAGGLITVTLSDLPGAVAVSATRGIPGEAFPDLAVSGFDGAITADQLGRAGVVITGGDG